MRALKLAASIVICLAAGAGGARFTAASVDDWYQALNKPAFSPPDSLFAPVWTLLYLMMGVALFLAWSSKQGAPGQKKAAMACFAVQLLLNVLWSALFFGLQNPLLAFVEILILWAFILLTIILFGRISRFSAYLLTPYLLWVTFAAILNYSIYALN